MNDISFDNKVLNAEPTPVNPPNFPQNSHSEPPKNKPLYKKKFCFASITYLLQAGIVFVFLLVNFFFGILQYAHYLEDILQQIKCIFSDLPLPQNEYMHFWGLSGPLVVVSAIFNIAVYSIMLVSIAVMVIMLFAKCHKPIIVIPFFGFTLSNLIFIIKGFAYTEMEQYFERNYEMSLSDTIRWSHSTILSVSYAPLISHIFVLLGALLSLIFVIILSIKVKQDQKEKNIIQKIWFIPIILRVFTLASFPAEYIMDHWDGFIGVNTESTVINALIYSIEPVLVYLPLIVSEFLLCLWLAGPYKKIVRKVKKPQPVVQYVPVVQPAAEPNAAQQLMEYKNLLDMGAITQEEFEAKKKQILGL